MAKQKSLFRGSARLGQFRADLAAASRASPKTSEPGTAGNAALREKALEFAGRAIVECGDWDFVEGGIDGGMQIETQAKVFERGGERHELLIGGSSSRVSWSELIELRDEHGGLQFREGKCEIASVLGDFESLIDMGIIGEDRAASTC